MAPPPGLVSDSEAHSSCRKQSSSRASAAHGGDIASTELYIAPGRAYMATRAERPLASGTATSAKL
eukprot:scaffold110230_cov66-Phaeocystis_antarctica.AAC.2